MQKVTSRKYRRHLGIGIRVNKITIGYFKKYIRRMRGKKDEYLML
jgi:hypothetical protein